MVHIKKKKKSKKKEKLTYQCYHVRPNTVSVLQTNTLDSGRNITCLRSPNQDKVEQELAPKPI